MISVIIPMYNEEKVIEKSLETLKETLDRDFKKENYEVLVVSDG